jgi:hypothetical protein
MFGFYFKRYRSINKSENGKSIYFSLFLVQTAKMVSLETIQYGKGDIPGPSTKIKKLQIILFFKTRYWLNN